MKLICLRQIKNLQAYIFFYKIKVSIYISEMTIGDNMTPGGK